ncbi:hypothetical protein TNCV_963771 [Trichonephila clavipes]|nr:hypothetical protein TNCV_963771 [Trichonephila clavipes]
MSLENHQTIIGRHHRTISRCRLNLTKFYVKLRILVSHPKAQLETTFGSPQPASSVDGNGHYCRPVLSGKITGISYIRIRILVHHPENDREEKMELKRDHYHAMIFFGFKAGLNQDKCFQRLTLEFGDPFPYRATVFR